MKVLLANKFFYDHGGPETVLFLTRDLLHAGGHHVIDFSMQDPRNRPSAYARYFSANIDLQSVRPTVSSVRTAARFLDSRDAAKRMRQLVRDHRPDVAHLHSINHQLTPSIVRVLRDEGIPTVMTLHDYKLVCPAYTMLADGGICERCSGGRYYRATTSRCRGAARSALLTAESYLQHRLLRSYRGISLFLAPSRFLAAKFREMGFDYPLEVVPNPTTAKVSEHPGAERGDHFLFVGRAVPEKGLVTLCRAAIDAGVRLLVAGDGPQLAELLREYGSAKNIEFLGRTDSPRTQQLMSEARAVVVPSEWYENQSMVILESLCTGTPVIASDIGGNPEMVRRGETGLLHEPRDVASLGGKLRWAVEHPHEMAEMGEHARVAAREYSPERYIERLMGVYTRVMAAAPAAVAPISAPEGGR